MQDKSNSFRQVTPFIPRSGRIGESYKAFPVDIIIGIEVPEPPPDPDCNYEPPQEMASPFPFFQGFAGSDFTDPLWTSTFNESLPAQNPGYDQHSGNMFLSEDGKKIVVWGDGVLVLTRNEDDSFDVEELNDGGGTIGLEFTMSRGYIIAGSVNGQGAVWLGGPTAPPTIDPSIQRWDWITGDGTKLFGTTTSGDVIERKIAGNVDTILESGTNGNFSCVDHCGETAIVNSDEVYLYKKIDGVWSNVGTMADENGDTGDYPSVTVMSGDGTIGFGMTGGSGQRIFRWDLTGSGVITAGLMNVPGNICAFCDIKITGMSSDKKLVVGYYVTNDLVGSALYWLQCEDYSQARNLDSYLTSQGLPNLGFDTGEYSSIDVVVTSATGEHFVVRANKEDSPGKRSMYYAAVPYPLCGS